MKEQLDAQLAAAAVAKANLEGIAQREEADWRKNMLTQTRDMHAKLTTLLQAAG
jgi:BMFP domain-containing protein YqiC